MAEETVYKFSSVDNDPVLFNVSYCKSLEEAKQWYFDFMTYSKGFDEDVAINVYVAWDSKNNCNVSEGEFYKNGYFGDEEDLMDWDEADEFVKNNYEWKYIETWNGRL